MTSPAWGSNIIQETFVLENNCEILPLKFIATRLRNNSKSFKNGFTLVFVHGNGAHKEAWNPVVQYLFQHMEKNIIHTVWMLDLPNHGDSAELNAVALETSRVGGTGLSISELAKTVVALLNSPFLKGHRVILIGHSLGASVCMYSTKLFPRNHIPLDGIILVEPFMLERGVFMANAETRMKQLNRSTKGVLKRKKFWESRELARQWFVNRYPWNQWDDRLLELYLQYGLKDVGHGVTLKCVPEEEVVSFIDFEATFQAFDQITVLCSRIPIHVIFGDKVDLVPRYSQDSVTDTSKGRQLASVTRIPGVGHMILQEQPDLLSGSILKTLMNIPGHRLSKL